MAGKLELDLQRVDVSKLVDAAVDVVRPNAAASGVRLDVMAPPHPVSLVGDAVRLRQVLWNLLSNAVKFTPREGRVAIRWSEHNGQVRIAVSDTGQGISRDFLPYVFDRFRQAEGEKQRARTGLGLALVREMVQAHGGTVLAESPGEGRGSQFTVSLPVSSG
jgi:signal transduction histidine kinase